MGLQSSQKPRDCSILAVFTHMTFFFLLFPPIPMAKTDPVVNHSETCESDSLNNSVLCPKRDYVSKAREMAPEETEERHLSYSVTLQFTRPYPESKAVTLLFTRPYPESKAVTLPFTRPYPESKAVTLPFTRPYPESEAVTLQFTRPYPEREAVTLPFTRPYPESEAVTLPFTRPYPESEAGSET
ncbi:hypothetical protein STEG23_024592 [Scotinomys teguina]